MKEKRERPEFKLVSFGQSVFGNMIGGLGLLLTVPVFKALRNVGLSDIDLHTILNEYLKALQWVYALVAEWRYFLLFLAVLCFYATTLAFVTFAHKRWGFLDNPILWWDDDGDPPWWAELASFPIRIVYHAQEGIVKFAGLLLLSVLVVTAWPGGEDTLWSAALSLERWLENVATFVSTGERALVFFLVAFFYGVVKSMAGTLNRKFG